MPRKKYFTPRDIDHLIPKLEKVFEHMAVCKGRAEALAAKPAPALADQGRPLEELVQNQLLRSQIEFLMGAVQDDINHIMTLGGVTKDVDAGLVDFPGQIQGEDVWLCWKRGETKVRFWHAIDAGFSERQALRPPPESTTTFH
jgi:hypothetical protein